jgi:hypothetical protein
MAVSVRLSRTAVFNSATHNKRNTITMATPHSTTTRKKNSNIGTPRKRRITMTSHCANLSQRDGPNVLLDQEETRRQEPLRNRFLAPFSDMRLKKCEPEVDDFSF